MWPHQGTPLMLRITKPVGQVITAGFPTGPRNVMTVVFCISNYFMHKADYSSRPLFPNSRNHCFCSAKFHTPRSCPRSLPEELLQLFDIEHWGKGFRERSLLLWQHEELLLASPGSGCAGCRAFPRFFELFSCICFCRQTHSSMCV